MAGIFGTSLGQNVGANKSYMSDPNLDAEQQDWLRKKENRTLGISTGVGAVTGLGIPGAAIGAGIGTLANKILQPIRYRKALGQSQTARGYEAEKNLVRPDYVEPERVKQSLNLQGYLAQTGIPQESKDYNQAMVDRNIAYTLQQTEGRKGGLAGLGALSQGQMDNANQLMGQDSATRLSNIDKYASGLMGAAGYQDKAFDLNKMQPYQMAYQRVMALQGSGLQNTYGASQEQSQLAQQGVATGLGAIKFGIENADNIAKVAAMV